MKHETTLVTIFCCALGLADYAAAQKPNRNLAKIILPNEKTESYIAGNMRIDKATGLPAAIYNAGYAVTPSDPVTMAQQYLREHSEVLGLKPDLGDLAHFITQETAGGWHVRFNQRVGNVPVYLGEVTVTINRDHVVTFVANGYKKITALAKVNVAASISAQSALAQAKDYLAVSGKINLEKAELIVYQNKNETRLAYKTTVVPAEEMIGDWEILVDAKSGEVFRAEDKSFHYRDRGRAAAPATAGTGYVFDPDPLTKTGSTYATGGYIDNNDVDSADLTAQRVSVTLPDITLSSKNYLLKGPYAEIVDSEAPLKGLFSQTSSTWNFSRNADAFEAVNVYYHLDKSMRYVNVTLAIPLMPFQYTGGVKADPHGMSGADDSHYLGSTGQLAFGEGGVDDAEDEEVILHELGHGLHDWATHGQISQVEGLSEGCGDYWAASYTRSLNKWTSSAAEYNWVFHWDGHNEYWAGRIVNYGASYPGGLLGNIYSDGQMWSSTLMSIWNGIGRTATDKDFLQCLSMLNSSSTQNDAANAFYQADAVKNGGVNQPTILALLQARGYTIAITTPAAPSNLVATATSGSQINLTWTDNATNETGFYLERKTGSTGTYGQIAALGANMVSYSNTGLTGGTAYYYRLRAYNGAGNSAYSNEANATTPSGSANLALGKTATATSQYSTSTTPTKAVDGSTSTYWGSVKLTASNKLQYLTVNLGSATTVSKAIIKWNSTNYPKTYAIQVSPTGTTFTTVYTDNAGNGGDDICTFTPTTTQYVRIEMSSYNKTYYQVKEFELYANAAKSDGITAVKTITATMPDEIVLQPNYPNPFNPSTTISFWLPERMHVTLKIINVYGQEAVMLLDSELKYGAHQIVFEASGLTSGIYFAVLQAGERRQVRQLTLMK